MKLSFWLSLLTVFLVFDLHCSFEVCSSEECLEESILIASKIDESIDP